MGHKAGIKRDWQDNLAGVQYKFGGMNNVLDPVNLPLDTGWFPDCSNIYVDHTQSANTRFGYISSLITTDSHSAWSDGATAYWVDSGILYSWLGSGTAKVVDAVENIPMDFCKVNNTILYSNGIDFGIIGDEGVTQRRINSKPFKTSMLSGTCIEFYNGRVYLFNTDTIYCSDTFDSANTDIRFNVVAKFRTAGTMIKRVEDGLFIGTESEVWFLRGNGPREEEGGFTQELLATYGVVKGTAKTIDGDKIPDAKTSGEAVLFLSKEGVCIGSKGGQFKNVSIGVFSPPEGNSGCAGIHEHDGCVQYIITYDKTSSSNRNSQATPTFDINIL